MNVNHTEQLATGGAFVTIEQAEQKRQGEFIAGLKGRNPELYQRALTAVVDMKRAAQELTEVRLALAGALGPSGVSDALDVLDRDARGILQQPAAMPTVKQVAQVSQPLGYDPKDMTDRTIATRTQTGVESIGKDSSEKVPKSAKN